MSGWMRPARREKSHADAAPRQACSIGQVSPGTRANSCEYLRTPRGQAHVPFKSGSEALTEIIAGRIEYYFCPANTALPFIREGKIKALAVSPPKRIAALPDVPTVPESGFKDSDYSSWVGLLAPANTPKEIVERLHKEITAALQTEKVKERRKRTEGAAGAAALV
jgi:tripartite-type tricarboxylate transporter receptor subunit TctC